MAQEEKLKLPFDEKFEILYRKIMRKSCLALKYNENRLVKFTKETFAAYFSNKYREEESDVLSVLDFMLEAGILARDKNNFLLVRNFTLTPALIRLLD